MASIISEFPENLRAATIERITLTKTNDVVSPSREAVDTIECLYWEGSAAQAFISERFRDRTSAVIGVYPGTDILENDIVTVEGLEYHALSPDNIGAADEVIIVGLEVYG